MVAFPGRSGWIRLPAGRRAAASGVASYSACKPSALALQYAAWAVAGTVGARGLGRPSPEPCPLPESVWQDLVTQWSDLLGPFDGVLPLLRRQEERSGFALLLHLAGRRTAFVKLRETDPGVEPGVLAAAGRVATPGFAVPQLLGQGAAGNWYWHACRPLPARVTRPAVLDPSSLAEGIAAVVSEATNAGALLRPSTVPGHWVGAHGDLSQSNVRRSARSVVVFDWEDAEWAPPGTDVVSYHAAAAAARGRTTVVVPSVPLGGDLGEAVQHCLQVVERRPVSAADADYHARLLVILRGLQNRYPVKE